MMTHAFKAGVACEEHFRCVINFCDPNYSKAIIDVSKDDFKKHCVAHKAERKLIVNWSNQEIEINWKKETKLWLHMNLWLMFSSEW